MGIKKFANARLLSSLFLSMVCITGHATLPLLDSIEYEGKTTIVGPQGKAWMAIRENEAIAAIRISERCTAIGGPRANWRIKGNRLWLIGLFRCGGDISLKSVYGEDEPIFADWVTDRLVTYAGKELCKGEQGGPGIHERTVTMNVEKGVLKQVIESSNLDHPGIPTLESIRKLLRKLRMNEYDAESMVGELPCFSTTDR